MLLRFETSRCALILVASLPLGSLGMTDFVELTHPVAGTFKYPGAPLKYQRLTEAGSSGN
jgi:hypothetical protein